MGRRVLILFLHAGARDRFYLTQMLGYLMLAPANNIMVKYSYQRSGSWNSYSAQTLRAEGPKHRQAPFSTLTPHITQVVPGITLRSDPVAEGLCYEAAGS